MTEKKFRRRLLWGIVIGFVLLGIQWQVFKELTWGKWFKGDDEHGFDQLINRVDKLASVVALMPQESKVPGNDILKNYATPTTRPEDDLQAMAHVFSNLRLLVKGDAPFRMGANEEFAAALMGRNAAKEVFLMSPHACLNAKGQLVDRWGQPLFFHVRDAGRIDLRSAGPDGEMWTADDLHRRHDGEFFRDETLPSENPREGK
ncbi:MAG: hypothetical protein IPK22_27815 [Verrucomicrobiaceae bacterium]|nr:hypothetical protein [Verrucomicrobiaceae bacterium]